MGSVFGAMRLDGCNVFLGSLDGGWDGAGRDGRARWGAETAGEQGEGDAAEIAALEFWWKGDRGDGNVCVHAINGSCTGCNSDQYCSGSTCTDVYGCLCALRLDVHLRRRCDALNFGGVALRAHSAIRRNGNNNSCDYPKCQDGTTCRDENAACTTVGGTCSQGTCQNLCENWTKDAPWGRCATQARTASPNYARAQTCKRHKGTRHNTVICPCAKECAGCVETYDARVAIGGRIWGGRNCR